jgi:hypothetical protein
MNNSLAAVRKSVDANQDIGVEDARPIRLACAYICHATTQPRGKWKLLTDMFYVRRYVDLIKNWTDSVARTADLDAFGAEGVALKKDIQDMKDRLEGKGEVSTGPRKQAKMRCRRSVRRCGRELYQRCESWRWNQPAWDGS